MGIMCSYKLWVLGEDAKQVVKQLEDDGWTLVSQCEMGAEFECEGKYLLRGSPQLLDYPHLVVVMSADHDADMSFNHLLCAEQSGHCVSGYWPYDPERDSELWAIATCGFDPNNLLSEALYEHGIEEALRRYAGNEEWCSLLDSHAANMAALKDEVDEQSLESPENHRALSEELPAQPPEFFSGRLR